MKICTKCEQTKPLDDFYKHPTSKDKKTPRCKECIKEDSRLSHLENPRQYTPDPNLLVKQFKRDIIRKSDRKAYMKKYHKAYYKKNRERLIEASKAAYHNRRDLEG